MATTATLEQNYWHGQRESHTETLHLETWERRFLVDEAQFDTLAPALGDTDSTDTDKIVARVQRQEQATDSQSVWMIVTYNKNRAFS